MNLTKYQLLQSTQTFLVCYVNSRFVKPHLLFSICLVFCLAFQFQIVSSKSCAGLSSSFVLLMSFCLVVWLYSCLFFQYKLVLHVSVCLVKGQFSLSTWICLVSVQFTSNSFNFVQHSICSMVSVYFLLCLCLHRFYGICLFFYVYVCIGSMVSVYFLLCLCLHRFYGICLLWYLSIFFYVHVCIGSMVSVYFLLCLCLQI